MTSHFNFHSHMSLLPTLLVNKHRAKLLQGCKWTVWHYNTICHWVCGGVLQLVILPMAKYHNLWFHLWQNITTCNSTHGGVLRLVNQLWQYYKQKNIQEGGIELLTCRSFFSLHKHPRTGALYHWAIAAWYLNRSLYNIWNVRLVTSHTLYV